MAPLRFRAWHSEFKKMYPYVSLSHDGTVGFCWSGTMEHVDRFPGEYKNMTVMQSTGLKDKNGKEIFEGDIYKRLSGVVGVIQWNKERACFSAPHIDGQRGRFGIVPSLMEVIGNVHENPDLLPQ